MKATTPAKHKTPNYRQEPRTRISTLFGAPQKITYWVWAPVPLRADRKDLP